MVIAGPLAATTDARAQFPASLSLGDLDGTNGFVANGIDTNDLSGFSVSDAGDINGDGVDDVIIGARRADPNGNLGAGESYVLFGKTTPFAASLDLSDLDGTDGFVITGVARGDSSGVSVSGAGDVNGDGIDDIIIGAYSSPIGIGAPGASYVVFGKRSSFSAELSLSSLNGVNGFALSGTDVGIFSRLDGSSVSNAGDINGDGLSDLVIGAHYANSPTTLNTGVSYVVFGKDDPFAAFIDLGSLNGVDGFAINGINRFDYSGSSVSDAGDVNGDGIDDLVIGAYIATPDGRTRAGETYVVFGSDTPFAPSLELSSLNGVNGFVMNGIDGGDASGFAVSGAGDVNGDGIDDLLIGADGADFGDGEGYVVFGSTTPFTSPLELSSLNGDNGFVIRGTNSNAYGGPFIFAVSDAGDVNGDGVDDIIVGERYADPNGVYNGGASYVVFGSTDPFSPTLELSSLNGSNGFVVNGTDPGDYSGLSVSGAGDVNGDGIDDLIIGAYGADPNGESAAGKTYVVFGRRQIPEPNTALLTAAGVLPWLTRRRRSP